MNESYETEEVRVYSGFWPLLILLGALVLWSGYQSFIAFRQSTLLNNEFQNAVPTIKQAQDAQTKLYGLAQDLIQTSQKDQYAAQIVREANIQVKPGATNSAAAGALPADSTK